MSFSILTELSNVGTIATGEFARRVTP